MSRVFTIPAHEIPDDAYDCLDNEAILPLLRAVVDGPYRKSLRTLAFNAEQRIEELESEVCRLKRKARLARKRDQRQEQPAMGDSVPFLTQLAELADTRDDSHA